VQVASNTIAKSVFTQLQDDSFVFNDQGNFSIKNIVADDAGAGIGYIQSLFPSAHLDFAIWAGTLTAEGSLGDTTYLQDYNISDLWVGSRDCNAILSGLVQGGWAAYQISPSTSLNNALSLDWGIVAACTQNPNPNYPPVFLPATFSESDSSGTFKLNYTVNDTTYKDIDTSTESLNTSSKTWSDSTTVTNSAGTNLQSDSLTNSSSGLSGTVSENSGTFSESTSVNDAGAQTITTSGIGGVLDASGATITQAAFRGAGTAVNVVDGINDLVDVSWATYPGGKLAGPQAGWAGDDISGSGLTLQGNFVTANVESNNTSFTVDSSATTTINGDNFTGLNFTINPYEGYVNDSPDVTGIGTGSTIGINTNYGDITTAGGDTIHFGADTTKEVLNGSSDTVTEGNSSDADVKGTNDTITLGADDKLMADGGGDHITGGADDVIDLDSNVTTTITGSDENIVGNSGDTIYVTGTSDHIYADSSDIQIEGADSGDVVYGVADSGDTSDWGGYEYDPGGYGGYIGGGYYALGPSARSPGRVGRGAQGSRTGANAAPRGGVDISTLTATSGAEDPGALPRAYLGDGALRARSSQGLTVPSYLSAQQLIHALASSPAEGHGAVLTGWASAAGPSALRSLAITPERELVHAHPH
jgi:hypothetical protein